MSGDRGGNKSTAHPDVGDAHAAGIDCLAGGGDMGALMREFDWAATPLGPVAAWPQSLRTAVSICLGTSFPMMICWGPELVMLYNDGYIPVVGQKHPRSLGQPLLECWAEIRDLIGPMFRGVMETGKAVGADDMMFPLVRQGYLEETYFVFSYSPIRDESGRVGGVLTTCTETTNRVLADRRVRTLRALAERATHAKTVDEALIEAASTFDPADIPFALLYAVDDDGRRARLVATPGIAERTAACPPVVPLGGGGENEPRSSWPLSRVLATGKPEVIADLEGGIGRMPGGPWPEAPTTAVVLPITRPGRDFPFGFLVAGVSARRALDDGYRGYLELVADHIATAVANARAHEEERRRAEALAEIDRAKTAFFSNVSHEFRTPLTLMLGPLEDVLGGQRGPVADTVRLDLETTQRNARRLLKLVNTLLDFSRIEAGRAQAIYEPVDLADFTRDLAAVFRSAIERAGLRLTVDCPRLPDSVYVDREMWEKIVLNLLSNALKFTFEGEIVVRLRERDDIVALEVRDTGIGIAPEELPNLFKRFHRVEGARARSQEGSGIGLALVQELLHLHGGEITVESEPARGSTFRATVRRGTDHLPAERIRGTRNLASTAVAASTFIDEATRWLPADGVASDIMESAVVTAVDGGPAALATSGARVLVADDNADMRDYLGRILGQNWRVECVADGAAAVAAANQDPPDILITDVMMPALDGFAVLRALRANARTRHIPVVMLSARAGEEARIEGLNAGADDYLIKPFSARELVARVGSHLALAAARRAVEHERATLRSLFMQAPSPICILRGERFTVELANPLCCEMWGRDHEEVIGRPLFEALPEIESQVFKQLLEQVLRTGEPYLGKETPAVLGRDGDRRTIHFNFVYAPLRNVQGDIEGIMVIAFDVTDEVHARDRLARAVHYAEMFTGILAHDLRSPLGAVLTAAQLILMRSGDDQIVKPVNRIVASAERMSRMIEQLLDFTSIRLGGGLSLQRGTCDLADLLKRVLAEVEGAAQGWKIDLDATGDSIGEWDGDRLAQVISNLAGNAVQHGARDAPLRVRLDGANPSAIVVSFENKGAIAPELIPTLFEPFRGARRPRDTSRGVGLGLFITKEIIGAHGGEITVASAPESGTRFQIVLPRRGGAQAGGVLSLSKRDAAQPTGPVDPLAS